MYFQNNKLKNKGLKYTPYKSSLSYGKHDINGPVYLSNHLGTEFAPTDEGLEHQARRRALLSRMAFSLLYILS